MIQYPETNCFEDQILALLVSIPEGKCYPWENVMHQGWLQNHCESEIDMCGKQF